MELITFTWIYYWCNFYYASITTNYVNNCVKWNLQFFFFKFLNNQFRKLWNDMSLDLLHCSMNILFVTILVLGLTYTKDALKSKHQNVPKNKRIQNKYYVFFSELCVCVFFPWNLPHCLVVYYGFSVFCLG